MKKNYNFIISLILISVFFYSKNLLAQQDSLVENFNDTIGWSNSIDWQNYFQFQAANNILQVTTTKASGGANLFTNFQFAFNELDLSKLAILSIKVKTAKAFTMRIDLQEHRDTSCNDSSCWRTTNGSPSVLKIAATADTVFKEYIFDFRGRFSQSYPITDSVSPSKISKLLIYIDPNVTAMAAGNIFYLSDLRMGTAASKPAADTLKSTILMNQIGFTSDSKKIAIVPGNISGTFNIKNYDSGTSVFSGNISDPIYWSYSNQEVRTIDFTGLTTPGTYYVSLNNNIIKSNKFEIKDYIYYTLATSAMRAYYYRRASNPVLTQFGGQWSRAEGHPDTVVYVHSSAASTNRPEGTVISCPRGWYDAGDYNKYVVNSGISTYTLLALYEHYSDYFKNINLNIPKSNNNIPDLLDEILWNMRWMLTMQDPNDGGVYHKCTSKAFCGWIMPSADNSQRYVVQKSTAATLDFAAVMAVGARIFKNFNTQLPGLSDSCQKAALSAWQWAKTNSNVPYVQPSDISTGAYSDSYFGDEFAWAGTELYLATKQDSFMVNNNIFTMTAGVPSWSTVNTLGIISLAQHIKDVNYSLVDTSLVKTKLTSLADILYNSYSSSPFKISLTTYPWGSNGEICNESFILLQAYRLTRDAKYLDAVKANLDYVLGKNPTGYCFVTDFGNKYPKNIQDRQSASDGIVNPVPGLMSGGPNANPPASGECSSGTYSLYPGLSYVDQLCSFSTNEVAINWNAPLAYVAGSLIAINNYKQDAYMSVAFDSIIMPACHGTNTGAAYIRVIGGIPSYKYSWSNGSKTQNLISVNAGIYYVTITDNVNFTHIDSVIINNPAIMINNFSYAANNNSVNFSCDSIVAQYIYFWNFGDGSFSNLKSPVHSYSKNGIFHVCLNVYDTIKGCQSGNCQDVTVNNTGCAASFTVVSDTANNTVSLNDNSTGNITKRLWLLGDGGSSNQKNLQYQYNVSGFYKISLVVYDTVSGCMDEQSQTVKVGNNKNSCLADFIFNTDMRTQTTYFFNQSQGMQQGEYTWDFGDTTIIGTTNPSHNFSSAGYHLVCLIAQDLLSGCKNTQCKNVKTDSLQQELQARFIYQEDSASYIVHFEDVSTGTYNIVAWDFGDGNISNSENPAHLYKDTGYFLVHLKISNTSNGKYDDYIDVVRIGTGKGHSQTVLLIVNNDSTQKNKNSQTVYIEYFGDASAFYTDCGDSLTSNSASPITVCNYKKNGIYTICTVTKYSNNEIDSICQSININTIVREYTPNEFLLNVYPNPLNNSATITYQLSKSETIEVTLFDVLGNEIKTLTGEKESAGLHTIILDAVSLNAGVYYIVLKTDGNVCTKKIVKIK